MQGASILRGLTACAFAAATAAAFAATDRVVCRYSYGGESRELVVAPTDSPYTVPAIAIGSYFKFRVVFRKAPADLASIRVYAYADSEEGNVPLHQATYPYPPPAAAKAPYGFTGQNFVYEPMRDGELEYWCRMADARTAVSAK